MLKPFSPPLPQAGVNAAQSCSNPFKFGSKTAAKYVSDSQILSKNGGQAQFVISGSPGTDLAEEEPVCAEIAEVALLTVKNLRGKEGETSAKHHCEK